MRWMWILLLGCFLAVGCSNSEPDEKQQPASSTTPRTATTSAATVGGDRVDSDDTQAPDSQPAEGGAESPSTGEIVVVPFDVDPGLRWTVLAVQSDDVLNVRSQPDPGAAKVSDLAPWQTNLIVSDDLEENPNGLWRRVLLDTGKTGWVNARFLLAQPVEYRGELGDELFAQTNEILQAVQGGQGRAPDQWLSAKALWVGGLGIYADAASPFGWIPRDELLTADDWSNVRTFEDPFGAGDCGAACEKSVNDFLGVELLTDAEISIPPVSPGVRDFLSYQEGLMAAVPDTLQWVRVFQDGSPELGVDWRRVALIFDHSDGPPKLKAVHSWGWTP